MRFDRLPLTYAESRERFRRAAANASIDCVTNRISAAGPDGGELTVEVAAFGALRPATALVVMSGVHGVEGFIGSALQSELLGRFDDANLPGDIGVVLIHAVNPWGMAWWRRQNESNVDLNRNWRRSNADPTHNDAYDKLHALACPDTSDLPPIEPVLTAALELVAERGLDWVRDGITLGQYRHPDGLHFGGDRTEESNLIIERTISTRLVDAERVLAVDLHTGHGPWQEITLLSDAAPGTPQDTFLHDSFGDDHIEATVDNDAATTGHKSGQIANGFRNLLPGAEVYATSVEFGTASDEQQFAATFAEQWVHRHGDRTNAEHAAAVWAYRTCFTPDDADWERWAIKRGSAVLDRAVLAVTRWRAAEDVYD